MLKHPELDAVRLCWHWGHDKISALHGGARVTRRPLRFWRREEFWAEILPALLQGALFASAAALLLWGWARFAAQGMLG